MHLFTHVLHSWGRGIAWCKDEWAAHRWYFLAALTVILLSSLLTLVCGILMVINHPPPVSVWVMIGLFTVLAMWLRGLSGSDSADFADCGVLACEAGEQYQPGEDCVPFQSKSNHAPHVES